MILFNHMRLAEQLGRGELSEASKFHYYFVLLIISVTFTDDYAVLSLYTDSSLIIYNQMYIGIPVTSTLIATIVAFRLNASGDNKDFVARIICLGVLLIIQAKLLSIFLYFLVISAGALPETLPGAIPRATDGVDVALCTASALYYCAQLIRGIRRTATQGAGSDARAI